MSATAAPPEAVPPGLELLRTTCLVMYPDQACPLHFYSVLKYWQGGPDPLDCVLAFAHPGDSEAPPHWHFVTAGFSDLHGDGRVHERAAGPEEPSGFGFELSFRVRREEPGPPPQWPARLLQALARYVFATSCLLNAGDFVPWIGPLDGSRDSRVQHMLFTSDPRLPPVAQGPLGSVRFHLLLGATADELEAAQAWSVAGIARLLPIVTDMRRGESLFDLRPGLRDIVRDQQEQHGSDLAGVTCRLLWLDEAGPPSGAAEVAVVSRPHVHLSYEAGLALPDALESRLRKGRHFTLVSAGGVGQGVSLVPSCVRGVAVTEEQPYAAKGQWLHLLITDDLLEQMDYAMHSLRMPDQREWPLRFRWEAKNLAITVHGPGAQLPEPPPDSPV